MKMSYLWRYYLIWVTILCIALALLESAVVIYLREIYYPDGFDFPMRAMMDKIILTEIIRELATLIILLSIGFLAGKNFLQRFAWFIFSFAVWDIFYYVFLKLMINWPDSFFTWDILFLIPVTWIGPVICPLIISVTMILLSIIIISRYSADNPVFLSRYSWWLLILGSVLVFLSFTWEYNSYMVNSVGWKMLLSNSNPEIVSKFAYNYIPKKFNWLLFIAGELTILTGIASLYIPAFHKK